MGMPDRNTKLRNMSARDNSRRRKIAMSDTPRTDAMAGIILMRSETRAFNHARTLERELNKANAIIAAALAYVEEFKEFPMEEHLIAILEGKVPAVNKKEEG